MQIPSPDAARVQRTWWDLDAERYHADHESYLSSFYWCPEMLHEADARLLGDVAHKAVLELGCGSAPCTEWLAPRAGFATGFDISAAMLARAEGTAPLAQADVQALPYRDGAFDVVFSAFGGLPFVPDVEAVFRDVARVLVDAGRLVFSVNHPMRWVFPDDPGPAGLLAAIPYFEDHYAEYDEDGTLSYLEYHRQIGDWVRALVGAGFRVLDIIEPEWPEELTEPWGQWSPLRGKLFPGTAIFVAELETQ